MKLTLQGGNKFTFLMPGWPVTVSAVFVPTDQGLPFTDVPANSWYYDAVCYACENGLMVGVSETAFGPNVTTSRAMIATILWHLAGSPMVNLDQTYTDVVPGAWYYDAVCWASSQGVAAGYGDGVFGPDDPITREQLAVMLMQFRSLLP